MMTRVSRRYVLGAPSCLASLGGCSLLFPTPGPQLYRLAPQISHKQYGKWATGQLVVSTPVAPASLDTERIALTRNRTTLDYFASAAWTDRVPLLMQGLMIDALEDSGQVIAVGRDSSDLNGDYRLLTILRDFQARYTDTGDLSPTIVVGLDAQLVRMIDRRVVGHIQAANEVPAAHNKLDSIVEAFDAAVSEVIGQIVSWTLRSMVRAR
jgi:cholesterol transport system auxiliary component